MRDDVVLRDLLGLHERDFRDFRRVEHQRVHIDVHRGHEHLVKLVLDVGAVVEHRVPSQRTEMGQRIGSERESDLFLRFADGSVEGALTGRDVAGDGHVPEIRPVLFHRGASLQQNARIGRDQPHVRGAVPVAVAMDVGFRFDPPGGKALRSENVEQLHARL
jgi:hypothetical protein